MLLKPCPFCGGDPDYEFPIETPYRLLVMCHDCGVEMLHREDEVGPGTDEKNLRWNRRATDDNERSGE
jgi:hypothetical protein